MPTKQEAAYYYRYYSSLFEEARGARNRANSLMDESATRKRQNESQLSECRTSKRNLEERLQGVKNIILFFQNDVTRSVNKANRSANSAGEKYIASIRCDSVSSASIGSIFHTKTIEEDNMMLMPAYQSCNEEKARLERAIQSLSDQMTQINNAVSSLESDIRRYRSIVSNAESNMRTYGARANWYAAYV